MIKILFICHGNICRSPMAQCVFQQMVDRLGRSREFYIDSMATSYEEHGNPIYPPAKRKMHEHGVKIIDHRATVMEAGDYHRFDYILGMDSNNIRNIHRICGGDPEGKVFKLLDLTDKPGDVADPYYMGNFEATYQDVLRGCEALLRYIDEKAP